MKMAETIGVENTVGKGEIARYEQFLLFPQCFQKTCNADTYKPGLVWERVKEISQSDSPRLPCDIYDTHSEWLKQMV